MSSDITVTFVSAFLNFNDLSDNDVNEKYISYFRKLANTGIPIVLFMDKRYQHIEFSNNVKIIKYIDNDEYMDSLEKRPKDIFIKSENIGHFAEQFSVFGLYCFGLEVFC